MTLNITKDVKRYASCAGLFLLMACAQGSGGGSTDGSTVACVEPQTVSTAFQQIVAKTAVQEHNGSFQLLVKMTNMDVDFADLKNGILAADATDTVKVKKISHDTAMVQFPSGSAAQGVVEDFISKHKISNLEEDHATFAFDLDESGATAVDLNPPATLTAPANPTGREVVVAIIDTGVDYTHKDLAQFMWKNPGEIAGNGIDDDHNGYVDDVYGWDFVNEDNDPMADDTKSYHGTHVAGIVKQAAMLANQGINLKIMPLKYLDSSASGRTSNAIRAIDYAISKGAVIMSNSWGSFGTSTALSDAIGRAQKAGILFTAAAGNGDANGNGVNIDSSPFYPAADTHSNVVSVAASDDAGVLAGWSNFGVKGVDLGAPGVSILSARNGNTYARLTGTSMATPYISGLAASLWSKRPDLNANEIRNILLSSVNQNSSYAGKDVTGGTVNLSAAVQLAAQYQHDPSNTGVPAIVPSDSTQCSTH